MYWNLLQWKFYEYNVKNDDTFMGVSEEWTDQNCLSTF